MMLIHTAGVIWIIKDILCKSRSGISVKYTVHVVYICCPCVGPSVTNALQMRTSMLSFTQWAEEVDVDLTVDWIGSFCTHIIPVVPWDSGPASTTSDLYLWPWLDFLLYKTPFFVTSKRCLFQAVKHIHLKADFKPITPGMYNLSKLTVDFLKINKNIIQWKVRCMTEFRKWNRVLKKIRVNKDNNNMPILKNLMKLSGYVRCFLVYRIINHWKYSSITIWCFWFLFVSEQ